MLSSTCKTFVSSKAPAILIFFSHLRDRNEEVVVEAEHDPGEEDNEANVGGVLKVGEL